MTAQKKISELFIVKYGVNLELNKLEECKKSDEESINFVSRTDENNGISAFVKKINGIVPNEANTISVAGGGSVLASFYQPEPYYSGRDLYILTPINKMTSVEMIYYSMCIRSNRYRYNYGRQANKTLKDILVPSEMPKEFSDVSLDKTKSVIISNLYHIVSKFENKSGHICDVPREEVEPSAEVRMKKLEKLFKIEYPPTLIFSNQEADSNGINFVSSSAKNNGVVEKVKFNPKNKLYKNGSITVPLKGSVLMAFVQPEDFYVAHQIAVLTPKEEMSLKIKLFYCLCIKNNAYKYNFGRQADKTLKDILVPSEMPKEFSDVSLDKIVSGIISNLCPTVPHSNSSPT